MRFNENAYRLIADNPGLNYAQFRQLTGLSRATFAKYKSEANVAAKAGEDISLRFRLKQKLIIDMKQTMKEKHGYANLKHTPFERG